MRMQITAAWTWSASGSGLVVSGYPGTSGLSPTKTGLTAADLRAFFGIPIQIYGNPPTAIPDLTLLNWIRYAEDYVEQETGLLLCQTQVASPPAVNPQQCTSIGLTPVSGTYMQQGLDYDLEDAAYDFI